MAVRNAKKILALRHRKAREHERKFVVEGIRLVEEALGSNAPVDQLVFDRETLATDVRLRDLVRSAETRGVFIQQTDRRALKSMSETQTPEGVLGVVRMAEWDRDRALGAAGPLLLLDRIRDPGNLGLILRTAEAAGAAALFLSPDSVELYNSKVVRASRGSIFRLPVFPHEDLAVLIRDLKARNLRVLSTRIEGTPYHRISCSNRFALLLGNETFGVDSALESLADDTVTIPIASTVNSLNVAVAAGILLFRFTEPR